MKLVFLDTETTALHPGRRPWEIALLERESDGQYRDWVTQIWDVDLSDADPASLKFGKFYQRHIRFAEDPGQVHWLREKDAAPRIEEITRGAHLVGANPSFDADCLAALLRRHGLIPAWHYRMYDVESLTAGYHNKPIGGLAACAESLGIDFPADEQHTALGDARMALRIWDAIITEEGA